ncbi:MAG: tRNA-dihydrouridine synthase, partial [Clostridia bacterium]|nr:tRNA-dihydrouridine synthase [Clostridia bacterium]
MKLYFAPLEGITTFTYRNTHFEMFGGCDEYFSPFLTPTDNERLSAKTMRDILPEKNTVNLRVQCLANSGEAFINLVEKISRYGYNEVNLNLGCPSGTVVKKSKGSGALRNLDQLYSFLDYIYSHSKMDISIKSRTGFSSHTEF